MMIGPAGHSEQGLAAACTAANGVLPAEHRGANYRWESTAAKDVGQSVHKGQRRNLTGTDLRVRLACPGPEPDRDGRHT
jgi:hypothetical protein